ncbi:MAG: ABC transporter ATP-binding protein [Brumimicrobium sp.]|nr:ABC transporter ATP-binding protein [Brumimicrobium sp.]
MSKDVLNTEDLTKFYGSTRGIKDVSISLGQGEIFGFIGPNGAGKSTFIRTVLGLIHPTSGNAQIFGKDILKKGAEIRQKIGYVPSEINYYSGMTAGELLKYSASFYKNTDLKKIDSLADRFELDLKKDIEDLSFGNKRKVSIIQSVLHEPELLILDEATGGLDPLMQNRFFKLLEERNKEGMTILYSSHILSEVQRICHRAAIIKNGEIIKTEDIRELLKKQMKNCRIIFENKPDEVQLPENAQNEEFNGDKLMFEYLGPVKDLVKWIADQEILDVAIEEPTLENIFMNYYERDNEE